MASVAFTSGVRNALTSLSSVKTESQQAQDRLATGRKVNSAVDSPVNFFTAAGLNDRASQLTGLLDGISNGIQTITAASKGIDSITKLVTSLQSTIKQAQNDAAANRPKIVGTPDLSLNSTTLPVNASKRDITLNKVVFGTGAGTAASADDPATTGTNEATPGDLGVANTANVLQIRAGSTTFRSTITATTTVRDLVNAINSSGIATASVGDDGKLAITGTGSDALSVELGAVAANNFTADATETAVVFGATSTGVVASGNSTVRSNLVKQFNDLRDQIDGLAKDAGYNGINLLGGDKLSITFNEKTGTSKAKLDVQGETVNSANLGITKAVDGAAVTGEFSIQNDTDLAKAADSLTNVLSSLRSTASSLGSQLSTVQTRQEFTRNIVSTLNTGADNLVNADTNEEGAKLLALQTRQQLSQTALSLSNQADQAILRLF